MIPYNISQSTLWIVGGFLLTTLALGLYAGRGIKNIKEYALGSQRFGTVTLVITFLATNIGGGSVIGMTKTTYSTGIILTIACLAVIIQYLLFALLIGPKIKDFNNCLTIGDLVGKLYGQKVKFLAGILTLISVLCKGGVQLLAIGNICEILLGIKSYYIIIFCGIVLGIYSSLGGIKSVTITDVFQFIIIIIAFPLIASLILNKIGSYKELFVNLPKEHLYVFQNKEFYYYLSLFLIWSILPMTLLDPADMQRIFMAPNKSGVRKQFFILSAFDPAFRIVIMLIGLGGFILYPNINPEQVLPTIINNLLGESLRGLAIIGFIAVIMSTADSFLHAAGLIFSHDILYPIFKYKKKNFNELLCARIATVILVILSIFIAIKSTNLLDLYISAAKFTGPGLLFPLLVGILGIKTDKKSFVIGFLSGISGFFISNYFLTKSMSMLSIPFGIVVNSIFYMIAHIIQNKGIAWVKREEDRKEEKLYIPSLQKIFNIIINFIPTPKKIYNYSKDQIMKNGSQNILFGIYACINFTLPYFLWNHQDPEKYNLMTNMRFIGGVMAALLIVKDKWKEFLKPYYSLYWHITLIYCLPFITTVMFLLTDGSMSWLMNIGTSIFFLIILVTGEMFLILAPLGVGLALIFYRCYIGPIQITSLGFDVNYFLIYQILFSTVIGLLFAYKKRIFSIIKGNIGLNLGSSLCHEIKNTLYSLTCNQFNRMRMQQIEEQGTKNIEGKDCYVLPKELFKSLLNQTNEAINFDQDTLKVVKTFETIFKEYKKEIANPKVHSMKSLVNYTLKELHFLPGQKEKVKLNLTDDFYVKIPKSPFAFVISNIIRNAFKHGRASEVEIKLENHKLKIRDNGKGVPSSDLERIFKMHYTTGQENDSSGVGLGFAKLIVKNSYGEIWCESEQGENSYAEFIIQFPEVSPSEISKNSLTEIKEEFKKKVEYSDKGNIAIRMLKEGESTKKIEKYTKLNKSEIQEIKRKVDNTN